MTKSENEKVRLAIACFMEDEPNTLGGWEKGMELISDVVVADTNRRCRAKQHDLDKESEG